MKCKLSEVMDIIGGGTPKTSVKEYWDGDISWLSVKDFNNDLRFVYSSEKHITQKGLENSSTCLLRKNDIIISARGTVGALAMIPWDMAFNQSCYGLRARDSVIDPVYLYYLLKNKVIELKHNSHGSVFDTITRDTFDGIIVDIPNLDIQRQITAILSALDDKIELNNEINRNLEEQVQAIYRLKFEDSSNPKRRICRAEEYFDISIGKTPPRKEPCWFSLSPSDVAWVSISDMGSCGVYISDSSEYLTPAAVEQHNVKIVPDNTVLLSFKLTVGRVAITHGTMATNEAIAHFKTDKKRICEYLYCYLKQFNYTSLGSTSSIATAVNSKIIKAMPVIIPDNDELVEFHDLVAPMFQIIKEKLQENKKLAALRDTLLPKLMSGELDVSEVKI